MIKTSRSHPIIVDFVPAFLTHGGHLGMTFAPGKRAQGVGVTWRRDLEADLTRMRDEYHVDTIISLIETHEFADLGIAELIHVASAVGIGVYCHPIVDGGVPANPLMFALMVRHAVERLRDGETVVAHCRGGLGRAGTFSACCLRMLGVDADEAIKSVRVSRPGAIENSAQEQFVRSVRL